MKLPLIRVFTESPNPLLFFEWNNKIDQEKLGEYLREHRGGEITIRYRSVKKGSSRKWRQIKVDDFDDTYIYVRHEDGFMMRYRRARVVEFK